MARNNNTYAKRQRDLQKKHKAEDKRARRLKRKEGAKVPDSPDDGDRPDSAPVSAS
jgi:hypothetical protein